jgi:hypothetical protein
MPCRRPSHTTRRGTTAVSRQGTKSICVRKGFEFETEARSLGMDKRPGSFRTNCSRPHRNRPRYELVVNQKTAGVPQKSRFPGAGVPLPGTSLPVCPTEGARAPVNRLLGRDGCRPRPGTSEASASCFGCQITPVYWPGGGLPGFSTLQTSIRRPKTVDWPQLAVKRATNTVPYFTRPW